MQKPWLKSYPEGVPEFIDVDAYPDVASLMDETFEKRADWVGLVHMMTEMTFGELDQHANHFASYLVNELGLQKGDRMAVMMPNCCQYPIVVLGALRAGVVVVNTNPLYTPTELEHQLVDSGAKAMVVIEMFGSTLEEVLPHAPELKHIVTTTLGDMLGQPKKFLVNFMIRRLKKMVPAFSLPTAVPIMKALKLGKKKPFQRAAMSHDDLAFLQYTGGTTGVAKGAMLTHRNIIANVLQASEWLKSTQPEAQPGDCAVTALPLYHIFALTANFLVMTSTGVSQMLITNPRDSKLFLKALKSRPITGMTGVNTLFSSLLATPGFDEIDFSNYRYTLGGGMATQRAVAEKWQKVTGGPIVEAYGLTESSPAVTINRFDIEGFTGSIGLPIPSTEVTVRDDKGDEMPAGERGELCVRGPQVMKGYWQRPEETKKTMFEDGWLRTGDVAVIDESGHVFIVDRLKDMILVSGFNVYPNEIEDVAALMEGISDVGVIGVPDERQGEAVKLIAVRTDPTITEEALLAHCKEHLTGYKRPSYIKFVDELPMTPVGKILRRELRDLHGGEQNGKQF